MVVEKRQCRSQKKPSNIHPHITSTSLGSRFVPLDVDNDIDGDFTPALATVQEMQPPAPTPMGPLPVTFRGKVIVPLKNKVNKERPILKHTSNPSSPALHASMSKQAPYAIHPLDRGKHSTITLPEDTASVRHSDTLASNLPPKVLPSTAVDQLHTKSLLNLVEPIMTPWEPPDPSTTAPYAAPSNSSLPVMVEDSPGVSHLVEDVVSDMQQ
ncbi:hypothetical protein V6N11_056865 [Hibiscus sabdariffa]|uniref:Uncharacterized protein n=1 Tax=Hibiscus sabdariffa TaxID=183260 RepID=A0ABR2T529_9ROSI